MGPNLIWLVSLQEEEVRTQTHTGDHHVRTRDHGSRLR